MKLRLLLPLVAASALACSDDPIGPVADAGANPVDTGVYVPPDGGSTTEDTGPHDVGRADAGFSDPDIWLEDKSDVAGLRTHIKIVGARTSTMPPLLVLSDGPGLSHEYLLPHLKMVMNGRTMVFYDMRGTGLTSYGDLTATATLTAERHVADVLELLEFLRATIDTSRVDLLGHGYGGGIAALFAAAHPERVSRLVLMTPYPTNIAELVDSQGEYQRRMSSTQRERFMAILNQPECHGNDTRCYLQVLDTVGANGMCPENRNLWGELNFEYGSWRTLFFVETQLKDSRFDWRTSLASVSARTTIISGGCDYIPSETTQSYLSSIPNSVHFSIASSGHFPFVEAKDALQPILRSALQYP